MAIEKKSLTIEDFLQDLALSKSQKLIVQLSLTREPSWEALAIHLSITEQQATSELASFQTTLFRLIKKKLPEVAGVKINGLANALYQAREISLIDQPQYVRGLRINNAANTAKHEDSNEYKALRSEGSTKTAEASRPLTKQEVKDASPLLVSKPAPAALPLPAYELSKNNTISAPAEKSHDEQAHPVSIEKAPLKLGDLAKKAAASDESPSKSDSFFLKKENMLENDKVVQTQYEQKGVKTIDEALASNNLSDKKATLDSATKTSSNPPADQQPTGNIESKLKERDVEVVRPLIFSHMLPINPSFFSSSSPSQGSLTLANKSPILAKALEKGLFQTELDTKKLKITYLSKSPLLSKEELNHEAKTLFTKMQQEIQESTKAHLVVNYSPVHGEKNMLSLTTKYADDASELEEFFDESKIVSKIQSVLVLRGTISIKREKNTIAISYYPKENIVTSEPFYKEASSVFAELQQQFTSSIHGKKITNISRSDEANTLLIDTKYTDDAHELVEYLDELGIINQRAMNSVNRK